MLASADFNNDSFLDLAVAHYDEGTTSILLGNGYGAFTQQTKFSNGINAGTIGIVVGDLTDTGELDIVVVNSNDSSFVVFLGEGNGSFTQDAQYSTGTDSVPYALALGDLNNDYILDLVVSENVTSTLIIYLGDGSGSFTQIGTLSTGTNSGPYSIVIDYFNDDNNLDIAVANSRAKNIGVFLGNGTGYFGEQITYPTESGPYTLVDADFNGDGILDFATANYLGNSTSRLLGNYDGTFQTQTSFSTGSGSLPYSIRSGDFNRDNIPDLILPNFGTDNVGILLGYGNGNFRKVKTYSTGSQSYPADIAVGDFNRDNRLDFISANYNNNTVGIFLSTCS
jgi:hypothetical protein